MVDIIKWNCESRNANKSGNENVDEADLWFDRVNKAVKIRTPSGENPTRVITIRGERLRELRDIINQVLNE